ncbi:uncharacterized protein [Pyxicephalus adspersus]|uniref:uncharacterized protein n=1 Tax=Pyxicephalus adspersus TaxID=30357 RepID=UPI003B5AFF8E
MKVILVLLILFFTQGVYNDEDKSYCTEQPDSIRVEKGGSVTIPCHFSYRTNIEPTEVRVYWRRAIGSKCGSSYRFIYNHTEQMTYKAYEGRISMGGNPQRDRTATIRIQNLKENDGHLFCCQIALQYDGGKKEQWRNQHGTYLFFKGKICKLHLPLMRGYNFQSCRMFNPICSHKCTTCLILFTEHRNDPGVTQSDILLANEEDSVTISCSYNDPPGPVPMWREVFWRVGSPSGPFAYHPSELMVHPSYRGRSQIIGSADLQINGVHMSNHTTYYCFVMLKFCIGNNKNTSILRLGSGTQLQIIFTNIDRILLILDNKEVAPRDGVCMGWQLDVEARIVS